MAHVTAILRAATIGEYLEGPDEKAVADLFAMHPEYEVKLDGHAPLHYYVRIHPEWNNRNFMIVRDDGTHVHFSKEFALRPKPRAQWFRDAARNIVDPQTRKYRDDYFATNADQHGRAPCEATGRLILPNESDVHHAGENTFSVIVKKFLADRRIDPAGIEYRGTTDGARVLELADPVLAADFADYHTREAQLQVVDRAHHRRRRGA